jgi:hypothetical protein
MQNDRFDELYRTQGIEIIDLKMGLKNLAVVSVGGLILILIIFLFMSSALWVPLVWLLSLLLVIGLGILSFRAFQVNKKMIIKNGKVFFPASDVENSIMAIITLMPLRGMFYYKELSIANILEVKKDGYGSENRGYPLNIIDIEHSNNLVFTSRQKRDEFHTKLSFVLKQTTNDSADFGE